MAICRGCGIKLQFTDSKKLGYSPKEDAVYCQRCFRIRNYDDLTISMKTGIDPDLIIEDINKIDGKIIYMLDCFDLEAGLISGINRLLINKEILVVVTKVDLLDISLEKLENFVRARLRDFSIRAKAILFTSNLEKENREVIMDLLKDYSSGKPLIVMGNANVGKSSFLNLLLGDNILTKSRYPGTTLEINKLRIGDIDFIDTPGLEYKNSLLNIVDESILKTIIPTKTIKPVVYQLSKDQSLSIAGLVRFDFLGCDKSSAVCYFANNLPIHRAKYENALALWESKNKDVISIRLDKPYKYISKRNDEKKLDIVIDGLGFVSITNIKTIRVYCPSEVNVTFRKAMI